MSPLLDALRSGVSGLFAFLYAIFQYLKKQTRLATATDGFLDLWGSDYLGLNVRRETGQSDASYRAVLQANVIRERCTRRAVIKVLTDLTGTAPIVIEPGRPNDTGAWDGPGLGWDVAGYWGGVTELAFQCFVIAFRPQGSGLNNVAGLDTNLAAWDTPSQLEWIDLSFITDFLTDTDIANALESVRPAATTVWLQIH